VRELSEKTMGKNDIQGKQWFCPLRSNSSELNNQNYNTKQVNFGYELH
jgi:hypothetical protein